MSHKKLARYIAREIADEHDGTVIDDPHTGGYLVVVALEHGIVELYSVALNSRQVTMVSVDPADDGWITYAVHPELVED